MNEEAMSEQTREVPTLVLGDVVLVQNETCPKTKKRELYVFVIEVLGNNQYSVKIYVYGRVSLRNRIFLKIIVPVSS